MACFQLFCLSQTKSMQKAVKRIYPVCVRVCVPVSQESLANAKVNARQHCVVWSHWNAGNAIWRTTMFHVVASYNTQNHAKFDLAAVQGHPRSSILVSMESPYGMWLLSRIWYRFRDIDAYVVEFGEAIKNPAYRILQTEYSGCLDISAHA